MIALIKNINRALICLDALIRCKKNKLFSDGKTIIIPFQQIFGDSILFQSALDAYAKLYPKSEGFNLKILARPSVLKFMKTTLVLPIDIEYEEVDFKQYLEDFKYYKAITKKYQNSASLLIVPGTSLSAEIFATANNAGRKIGMVRCIDVTHPFIFALFYKLAYTERIKPSKDDMMLQKHRLMLNYLGDKDYKATLPNAIKQKKIISEDNYIVMCPGSSKMEKCWPIDRFAKIADYLVDTYGSNIHLCGGTDEKHFEDELMSFVQHKDKIISHIGTTTFAEWSSIVEYAELVVGNDSATIHLAAAHRRKAICIAGVYDKYQFFPYKVDELDEGDRLPVTILKDMPCEYCRTIGYDAGYGNQECAERIKNNKCSLCIDAITVDEIIDSIENVMKE